MQLRIEEQIDLTPDDHEPHAFLLKLSADSALDYAAGDWITIKGQNSAGLVQHIIHKLKLNPAQTIQVRRHEPCTIDYALTHHLELTLLDPAILNKLVRQHQYQAWSSRADMQMYAQGRDILDLLNAFPELAELGAEFLHLLSPLAPRYYSIASAPECYPNQVHVLYKAIQYQRDDRFRQGVTSNWMQQSQVGHVLETEIKPNAHFKLPDNPNQPVIMIAAGTGLAPFIGFMQARVQAGAKQNQLFFGETHQATRFLAQASLQAWQQADQLDLYTAFSRDQSEKFYVQDAILANHQAWLSLWQQGANIYICGDKVGLAKGVEQSIKYVWEQAFGWTQEQAQQAWLDAKKQHRIQLDVY
ncbi:MAG: NADP oxidoreductase [Thiomicrospira sp.]|uniref:NADP oxidoreductase n=1 Tax=Thiomicrospira sp. TaxID=935 RepID=UPI0019FDA3DB|nr:NADP oxidoreductase [Thiomicrospira sp.]MBE0492778.1 NADP oxidoreductase [Thiomicrospira sp.]